jgi:amidase
MNLTRRGLLSTVWATGLAACAGTPFAPGRAAPAGPDATEMAAMIRRGDISALEAVNAAIARAERMQPQLNFMVTDTFAAARAKAQGQITGPFAGVPTLVKDLNDVTGAVTRWGSRSTAGAAPATQQNVYINALLGSGLVCIGKSAAPEGGYLPTTEPLAFAPTRNPWDLTRSSAGSSGGAAVAVAAGVVPIAHANDGGGSVRMPAANCGLFGLKPSRGRLINTVPGSRPLDVAVQGCISRSVRDTAQMLASTEAQGPSPVYPPVGLVGPAARRPLRIGVLTKGLAGYEADPEVFEAVHNTGKQLEATGHRLSQTAWPVPDTFSEDFVTLWSLAAKADVDRIAARLGRPADTSMVEPFSLAMAEQAARLSPAEAQAVQGRLIAHAEAYDRWVDGFDFVMSPIFASVPSPLGYLRGDVSFGELKTRLLKQVGYTLIQNVSGAAAMSVPLAWSRSGLPIGIQFSAGRGDERQLLELAYELEAAMPWAGRKPPVFAA